MLIEFSVKNFLSFKDKITLSMEKGNGEENISNIIKNDITDLLRTSVIYGANASGKSNVIKAFTCAIILVRTSNLMMPGGKLDLVKPFLLDDISRNKPSEFEFIFITNNIKYRYYFSADENKIYDEILDAYYSQKPTNIFTRTNTNDYEFNSDKTKLEELKNKNLENKLFLATSSSWNYDKTRDPFLWFLNVIDTYDSFTNILDNDLISYSKNDKDLKEFTLKLLKEAGATEVHVRIASPAIKFPCFYGVDISTLEELISHRMNVEELCQFIEADSLAFISMEGLKKSVKHDMDGNCDLCMSCFSGNYVTKLYDSIDRANKDEK